MFVVVGKLIESKFYREREENYWESWDKDISLLNLCFESDTWIPKSNFSCYKFCPVTDCELNGRG